MKRDTRNTKIKDSTQNLAIWTVLWLVTLALASFGPKLIWDKHILLSFFAIMINLVLGAGMIRANIQYLGVLDELQKKIQLDAMGIALGVGIVGGLSYSVADMTSVINGDAEIGILVILVSISYLIAWYIGKKRYA